MVYLEDFNLQTNEMEEGFFFSFERRACFTNCYPFRFFPNMKGLTQMVFSDITIFCGSNGSGKTTLLNIIAEKLKLKRETPYNKTYFFDPYIDLCCYHLNVYDKEEVRKLTDVSRIITSDDVFKSILSVRTRNENLDYKRSVIFHEKSKFNSFGIFEGPTGFDADDPESVQKVLDYHDFTRLSASQYVKRKIGEEERTYSNGENGFRYFTDAIQPGGLYLLDEPENSLSPEMQIELAQYLYNMARFYKCQFILSTHSPFVMSIPSATIYNMDKYPVETCKWTEYENVRIYYEFFKQHSGEFE